MSIKEQLMGDLQQAMKDRDATRVSAIRMLRAAIQMLEIARTDSKDPKHGQPITETDLLAVVQREVNQRREALDFARKAGREDLIAKEEQALAIMEPYLPAQLSRDEIATEVRTLIEAEGDDFKKVMPIASQRFRGRADGKLVAEVVRELTQAAPSQRG